MGKINLVIQIECNLKAGTCGPCEFLIDYRDQGGDGHCSLFDEFLESRGRGCERSWQCLDYEQDKCPKCDNIFKDEGRSKGGKASKRKDMGKGSEGQIKAQAGRKKPKADIEQK